MMSLPMARKTRARGAELTCLCLVRFDATLLIDWRHNFLRKQTQTKGIKIMG
jgi:hypothetical protein